MREQDVPAVDDRVDRVRIHCQVWLTVDNKDKRLSLCFSMEPQHAVALDPILFGFI